jgi:hypothetical protein
MAPRWDRRLRLPKSEGGATICEKHEFIEAHFRDPEMSWEVDQAVTQAKDDGKRMEARLQELGEEANNLEDALSETEADRDRLTAELQAVRGELAKHGPSCDRCQSSHCCSVAGCTPPLCVTDPEGSLPLWMPWTNEDVRKRIDAVYAQADALHAELARVRSLLGIALPHVEASAGADHMLDGFRPRRRPIDDDLDAIRAALANDAKDET